MTIQQGISGASLSNKGYYLSFDQNTMQYTMSNGDNIDTDHFIKNPIIAVSGDIVDMLYHANYGVVRYKY